MNQEKTKKLTILGMFCALAFVSVAVCRIPIVLFLDYEPKDVIIAISGFIYGPLAAMAVSLVTSMAEMVTISTTGPIGMIMNVLASCSFACTAAYCYKKMHTVRGAVIGLIGGSILMTVVMLLWNYLITPIYLGYPREAVVELLIPAILPFNLLKSGLNTALTLLIYKPVVTALRKSGLLPASKSADKGARGWLVLNMGTALASFVVLISCVLVALAFKGVI